MIHPFAELIEAQYARRSDLFDNKDVLPDFELRTVKAVQSLGGDNQGFKDWFDALEWMKREIGKADFDICLIGCGAYGFPLAAHVKKNRQTSRSFWRWLAIDVWYQGYSLEKSTNCT